MHRLLGLVIAVLRGFRNGRLFEKRLAAVEAIWTRRNR